MPGISTRHPAQSELAGKGYSLLPAREIDIGDDLRESWLTLSIDYADLPCRRVLARRRQLSFSSIWAIPLFARQRRINSRAACRIFPERGD